MGELGARLVRAREARGLTLEDAERDTRISRRYLQALESEQFEVIPAPVYARGFLRSYSQYLGLDAKTMLELFPRVEDGVYYRQPQAPAPQRRGPTPMRPGAATAPSRPVWRQPAAGQPPAEEYAGPIIGAERPAAAGGSAVPLRTPVTPPPRKATRPAAGPPPSGRRSPGTPPIAVPETPYEPTIGIDIGVPVPARRLQHDPAGGTRSAAIIVVAIVAVLAVIGIALLISQAGGDDVAPPNGDTSGGSGLAPSGALTRTAGGAAPAATSRTGLAVTPGVVPNVVGETAATAARAIQEAGFVVQEVRERHATAPRGTVSEQAPAPGIQKQGENDRVIIVISDGP